MRKLIWLGIMVFLFSCACTTVDQIPMQSVPIERKYEIEIFLNGDNLKIVTHAKEPLTECGISNEEFKAYVLQKVKGTDYLYFAWGWKKTLTGEECITRAYVYYEKKKSRKE